MAEPQCGQRDEVGMFGEADRKKGAGKTFDGFDFFLPNFSCRLSGL
jgi:hypothetical protein